MQKRNRAAGTTPRRKRVRRKSGRKSGRKLGCLPVAILVALILAAVCICLLAPQFNISAVECEGNNKLSDETIIEASCIPVGDNIFLTNLSDYAKNVEELEYVESCKINRSLPGTVKITVIERSPAAYFAFGDSLILTDLDGTVVELINSIDTAEITAAKIADADVSTNDEETDERATPEPQATIPADGTIWGYDDDGDPIYRVNGGHYEFDEDGNRFFVSEMPTATPEPEYTESPLEEEAPDRDGIERTTSGTVIYGAPIVYGVDISSYKIGHTLRAADTEKFADVLSLLGALKEAGLLDRTTKLDAENMSDIKFTVEDRLEVWLGDLNDVEYKARFIATVIDNSLSVYERGIIDYRDSKLYVRSEDTTIYMITPTPDPDATPSSDTDDEDYDEDELSDDEDEEPTARPTVASSSNNEDEDEDEEPTARPTSRPTEDPDSEE